VAKKEENMKRVKWLHVSLLLLLALGLAMPAMAQQLYNSETQGSVIVFPKFIAGTTATGEPRSEFEISVKCPFPRDPNGFCPFAENTRVKLRAHWVCPADQKFNNKFICQESNFDLFTTIYGTLSFNPANVGASPFPTTPLVPTVGVSRVPVPPCDKGYLIAWVVDNNDRPIKFDALIGDAIIREPNGATSAYNGIPIQAVNELATGALIPGGNLLFDGVANYKAVTGVIESSLRFEVPAPAAATPPYTTVRTDLTLLTLDVLSNRPNYPTFVDLDFYNANEYLLSTYWEFICWTEVSLTDINPNLTEAGMFTRKGLVVSGPAVKFPFVGIADIAGPVTLLGIVETVVTSVTASGSTGQSYSYSLYHDAVPVPTLFDDNDARP